MKPQLLRLLTVFAVLLSAVGVTIAQDKPRWAIRGTGDINAKRTNDTYTLVKFETFGPELESVRSDAAKRLPEYLAGKFALNAADATVTEDVVDGTDATFNGTVPNNSEGDVRVQKDYTVTFGGMRPATFGARLVDEYVSFDENVDGTYDYTLYQLYAVQQNRETAPDYDSFSYTRSYRGQALVRSIIPGLGQWYKGQETKAYCIWGAEAVFVAGSIYFNHRFHNYRNDYRDCVANGDGISAASYHSKYKSWRTMRNIAIGGAVATYVYNLLDAAISKGPRQVVVKKKKDNAVATVSFGPSLVYDPSTVMAPAVGMTVTF